MNKASWITITLLVLANPSLLCAKQTQFSKVEKGDQYQFHYQWLDADQNAQSMSFSLAKSSLFDKFRRFKVFKPKMAERYVMKSVVKHLHKQPTSGVWVKYNALKSTIEITGKDSTLIDNMQNKVNELKQKYLNEYLTYNWYQHFTTHTSIKAIKPNHVEFANLSSDDLKPMKPYILDEVAVKNIRKATKYVLGFVQSIPYSRLESRLDSAGAGFNPPLKVLWENQGDCDSKVTLTAAILRALMPRVKMVLVFIDNHALIGVDILPEGDETTITVEGVTYLLAEPTGPAELPLGELSPTSELAVLQGQYIAEPFH